MILIYIMLAIILLMILFNDKANKQRLDSIAKALDQLEKQNRRFEETIKRIQTVSQTIPFVETNTLSNPQNVSAAESTKPINEPSKNVEKEVSPEITLSDVVLNETITEQSIENPANTISSIPEFRNTETVLDSSIIRPIPLNPTNAGTNPRPTFVPQHDKTWWEGFKDRNPDLEKFIGENLINKIGIFIFVLGISYFVRYAISKEWIGETARAGIGFLCGSGLMLLAHKMRAKYASFSSVLVAGAIAIYYFTIAISFHDYQLFGPKESTSAKTIAFCLMSIITAFSALVSLSYNRKELAVLALIGGFAVPFMLSTGSGNHKALFVYLIVLNIGSLTLAYYRKWNVINILSYIFTILIFGAWFILDQLNLKPFYQDALVFSFAFYIIFICANIVNTLKNKDSFSKPEMLILSSVTFLYYGVGMFVFESFHPKLQGVFTLFVALSNLVFAYVIYRVSKLDKKAVFMFIGFTLTFATLAIPIQFEGNYITLFWAAEAVLLLWLGQKSDIKTYKFGAVIVQGLMVISLLLIWSKMYYSYSEAKPFLLFINSTFLTGIFAVASFFAVRFLLKNETEKLSILEFTFIPQAYKKYAGFAGVLVLYLAFMLEIHYQANHRILGVNSAASIPIAFHLLFSAILVHLLIRSKIESYAKLVVVLCAVNILLFTFWFSNYSYFEHFSYIKFGKFHSTAYLIHYFSLAMVIYFGIRLYLIFKSKENENLFQFPNLSWIVAFIIIYIASSEMMINGLILSDIPLQDFKTQKLQALPKFFKYYRDLDFFNTMIWNNAKHIVKTVFPILWGVLSFIFLIIGVRMPSKQLRIIALSLLALTILKLFVYDISNISETGKIISFVLLGVLILIISFVYQKIKVLVSNDETNTNNNDSQNANTND